MHERIRARRTQLGLSYEKLAEAIQAESGKKIAWQTIQQWEKAGGTAPSRSNQAAAAKGLRCSVEWLMTGRGAPDDSHDLPAPAVVPEDPPIDRMILQYVTPKEAELLEQYRLSFQDGRTEIEITASTTKKRPLSLIRGVDDAQM
ncbi:MAG: Helix-turn-helix domain [Pseudoduganella sp.]|nr:Helix-turn-helix domain [Pseudoduganella sp.]